MSTATKNTKKWAIAIALVALIIFFLVKALTKGPDGPAMREYTVKKGEISITVLANGMVQPDNRVDIKPPINGRVETILVKEGAFVKHGQILAYMSSTERAAMLDAARSKGPEEVKTWEDMYKPTPILAPISGTIIQRNLEPGQSFTSNDAVLVMSDRLIVQAQVDETDIANVRVNQNARIVLDAYADQPMKAVTARIAFDAKTVNNVTTYQVDVLPEKTPAFMRSGMTANVTFEVRSKGDVLIIPQLAVKQKEGSSFVTVKNAGNGKAEERPITIGESDNRHYEVASGLSEGEVILVPEYRVGDGKKKTGGPFGPPGRSGGRRGH